MLAIITIVHNNDLLVEHWLLLYIYTLKATSGRPFAPQGTGTPMVLT